MLLLLGVFAKKKQNKKQKKTLVEIGLCQCQNLRQTTKMFSVVMWQHCYENVFVLPSNVPVDTTTALTLASP